jgi:DNA helicase HerA-like ATPase
MIQDTSRKVDGSYCGMVTERSRPRLGAYVRIVDNECKETYVARILDGPFYTKEPGAYYLLELDSMVIGNDRTVIQSRPNPGSTVSLIDSNVVQEYLGAVGDFKVGRLVTLKNVQIALDSSTLNRHIGVFGTTGSGKSNSLQVIAEEASHSNRAVLIFDIEGEYVSMNEPTDALMHVLKEFGKQPEGVKDLQVYVPAPNRSRNVDAKRFGIPFGDIELEIFSEVLGLSPFERVYLFDVARKAKELSGSFQAYDIRSVVNVLKKRIDAQVEKASLPEVVAEAHMGLYTKLSLVIRSGIVDAHNSGEVHERIRPETLCVPGRITVVDLNESSDTVRNLCISHLLKELFRYKSGRNETTPILIFLEEIHTFLSKAKRRTMTATLTMLTEMARQGRKRGIGLGFVSQQPALVPSELIELCNTRFIHRISSEANIQVLRNSTGNVSDSLWSLLPSFGNGEVLIASPKLHHSVIAQIRPNMSRRLRVEYS